MRANPSSFVAELLPLSEATATCFHIVSRPAARRLSPDDIETVRSDLALALAHLIPVFAEHGGAKRQMATEELYSLLENSRLRVERMVGLYVRRGDLIKAIEVLQRRD